MWLPLQWRRCNKFYARDMKRRIKPHKKKTCTHCRIKKRSHPHRQRETDTACSKIALLVVTFLFILLSKKAFSFIFVDGWLPGGPILSVKQGLTSSCFLLCRIIGVSHTKDNFFFLSSQFFLPSPLGWAPGEPAMATPSSRAARTRWSALAASALIQCFAGSSYCFGVYSPALKASQGYDQSALDAVAIFKDVGANAGILSGFLAAWAPAGGHRRPWLVLLAGAALCVAGYLPMWLAVKGFAPAPLPLMCFYMLLAAQAQTFLNTADVVTAVENFSDRRGTVIGIMKVHFCPAPPSLTFVLPCCYAMPFPICCSALVINNVIHQ